MAKNSWPVAADVTAALAAFPNPIVLPAGFDVSSQIASAISEWDRRSRYRPFFQTSNAGVPVPFDPPGPDGRGVSRGGGNRLNLENGLLSLSDLSIGVLAANGDTGQSLQNGIDYFPGPGDAPSKGEPYTWIDFVAPQRGLPRSIVLTGVWGYCSGAIPDDAWQAVLNLSLSYVLQEYREGLSNGLIMVKDDEVTNQVSVELIGKMGDNLAKNAFRTLGRCRLIF